MKINDKHKYDVDVIEIKLFIDKIPKNTFNENFVNTLIGSLDLSNEEEYIKVNFVSFYFIN